MVSEIAGWHARQPQGVRYARIAALRQALEAACRWGYISSNPAKQTGRNRQPAPRAIRVRAEDGFLRRGGRAREDHPIAAAGAAVRTRTLSARRGAAATRHVLLFPAARGGLLNLYNWRRREWAPAIEAAGIRRPARIYDLRSTFASNALAAGVSVFELARIMGTSTHMIERS
jgi:hypothetical protein